MFWQILIILRLSEFFLEFLNFFLEFYEIFLSYSVFIAFILLFIALNLFSNQIFILEKLGNKGFLKLCAAVVVKRGFTCYFKRSYGICNE